MIGFDVYQTLSWCYISTYLLFNSGVQGRWSDWYLVCTQTLASCRSLIIMQTISPSLIVIYTISASLIVIYTISLSLIVIQTISLSLIVIQTISPSLIVIQTISSSLIVIQTIFPSLIVIQSISPYLTVIQTKVNQRPFSPVSNKPCRIPHIKQCSCI